MRRLLQLNWFAIAAIALMLISLILAVGYLILGGAFALPLFILILGLDALTCAVFAVSL